MREGSWRPRLLRRAAGEAVGVPLIPAELGAHCEPGGAATSALAACGAVLRSVCPFQAVP